MTIKEKRNRILICLKLKRKEYHDFHNKYYKREMKCFIKKK